MQRRRVRPEGHAQVLSKFASDIDCKANRVAISVVLRPGQTLGDTDSPLAALPEGRQHVGAAAQSHLPGCRFVGLGSMPFTFLRQFLVIQAKPGGGIPARPGGAEANSAAGHKSARAAKMDGYAEPDFRLRCQCAAAPAQENLWS